MRIMLHRSTDPFDELFDVFREFDSFFRGTVGYHDALSDRGQKALPGTSASQSLQPGARGWPTSWKEAFHPTVDWLSKDGGFVLRMELPGVDPGDVDVSVAGSRLTIRGEKREQRESEEGGVLLKESAHGKFERSFNLPEGVKPD